MRYEVAPGEYAEVVAVTFLPNPHGNSERARLRLGNGMILLVDGPQAAAFRSEMARTATPIGTVSAVLGAPDDWPYGE